MTPNYRLVATQILSDLPTGWRVTFWAKYGGVTDWERKRIFCPYVRGDVSLKVLAHEVYGHALSKPIRPVWWGEVLADRAAIANLRRLGYEVGILALRRCARYAARKLFQGVVRGYDGPIPPALRESVRIGRRRGVRAAELAAQADPAVLAWLRGAG